MSGWQSTDMASAWLRSTAARNRMMAAATECMFERAGVTEGARVLDVGTGTGDTALMLAARVGPRGTVVAIDPSGPLIEAAEAAVRSAGLGNVTTRAMGATELAFEPGSFDAAVARNVLMFVSDLGAALRGVHRVLRRGARFAAITWADLAVNPFNAIPIGEVRARGRIPSPTPEVVRAFSLTDPVALQNRFEQVGFVDVSVERVNGSREFPSLEASIEALRDVPLYRELMGAMTEGERAEAFGSIEAAYRAFVRPDGSCAMPIESLVVSGGVA